MMRPGRRQNPAWAWAGRAGGALLGLYLLYWSSLYSNRPAGADDNYKRIGLWLKANTAPSAQIALVEIGTVGWYSERHIIDILGLVTPLNAEFVARKDFARWRKHYSPEYILVHDPLWPHEQSARDPLVTRAYAPDPLFAFPGYALLKKKSP